MEQIRGNMGAAWTVLKSLILAALVTVVLLLLLAFGMPKLQPEAGIMQVGIFATYVLSCFAGGMYCGGKSQRRKFVWGLISGILYFLLLFVISRMSGVAGAFDAAGAAGALLMCAAGGMAGGMLAR